MNAKKIMGAVLVALLAAALFIGAGAADDKGTVFVYQANNDLKLLNGTWTNGAAAVTISTDGVVMPGANFVVGTYTKGEDTLYITYPAATISGIAGTGVSAYSFIGGNLFQNEVDIALTNTSLAENVVIKSLYVTYPNATKELISNVTLDSYLSSKPELGKYSVQVVFDNSSFVTGAPASILIGEAVTFTVVEAGSATIAAAADELLKSEPVLLSITGQPGVKYNITYDSAYQFNVSENQLYFGGKNGDNKGFWFEMPNTGKVEFAITANNSVELGTEEEISLTWWNGELKTESVTVNFAKGTITAATEAASYFIGEKVTIIGTTTAGDLASYNVTGTNFALYDQTIPSANVEYGTAALKTFELEIDTAALATAAGKKLDVGTYTVTLKTATGAKATVAVVLKQPFISIVEAPEVIVQGDDAEFIINAEATDKIAYYIFGTNYFLNATTGVHAKDDKKEDISNQYKIELNGEETTANMDAGQYFMVIQHKMYDGKFNILSFNQAIYQNTTDEVTGTNGGSVNGTELFKVDARQTANAAQALCDALDSQNIDDMYVKYSFFVVGEDESFTISAIPTEVAQGTTLTISGVSTSDAEEYVTVEMISTAFAAVPKETVGSAAFIAVTTQIADDGTWEVTLDTSDLNVDEYSLKVACGDDTWKNVKINVVEGADEPVNPEQPEQPENPENPTEPEAPATPGFGALAALAGLGAVAVLLLRRE